MRALFDIAKKLEGLYRHASTHAAGVVIGDRPLSELVPLYRDPRSDMPVTQFDMKWVEPAGLVKFDFLGLKTLTVLDDAREAAQAARHRGRSRDAAARRCRESTRCWRAATRRRVPARKPGHAATCCASMRPDRFDDIIALVALYRPGPMENIPTLHRARKHGDEEPEYPHPMLEPILQGNLRRHHLPGTGDADRAGAGRLFAGRGRSAAPRDGQEDPRRRWRKQRERFVEGAVKRGVPSGQAEQIFELAGEVRRLRLQQEPRRGLRAGRLSDRLSEGALPGRIPRRVDDARHRQHRQALEFPPEAQRLGIEVEAPSINRSGRHLRGRATASSITRWPP